MYLQFNLFLANLKIDKVGKVVPFGAVLPLPVSDKDCTLPDSLLGQALRMISCYLGMVISGLKLSLQQNVNTKVIPGGHATPHLLGLLEIGIVLPVGTSRCLHYKTVHFHVGATTLGDT